MRRDRDMEGKEEKRRKRMGADVRLQFDTVN